MARVVWKYLVPFASARGRVPLMPLSWHARPVHAGLDPETGRVAVWVINDDLRPERRDREVFAFPTGTAIPDHWESWGSVITPDGYVWHVFAAPPDRALSG